MMLNKSSKNRVIKYPIAFDSLGGELVDLSLITDCNRAFIVCPECNSRFVAVINHQTPHFKHYGDHECSGTFESYIHKVVKELFKQITKIELPELQIKDLPEEHLRSFWQMRSRLLDTNIPLNQHRKFIDGLKDSLTEVKIVTIDRVGIERVIKTSYGSMIVDVVAHLGDKVLFIEPYYSNPIDDDKKVKIRAANIPTLSISLMEFLNYTKFEFSLSDLKKWLFIDNSKNWVYLNDRLYQKHIDSYKKYLWTEIRKYKRRMILNEISNFKNKNVEREGDLEDLKRKIKDINEEISGALEQIKRLSKDLEDLKE
ncbi:hypothetical protein PY092_06330 [Muricauda sp. 334s03]|uniref:Competence protein CoiA-like family protein n=1 Tax=Flagellimonas yonaguniensis TaxID=3031325 RepID=A0ABT5XX43_9FLAO|nr:hypothetical protein [[Muricauda] yonaguniensis]MDF0715757.1 hypothetical protein [[Muricauda] yonaguniensis]